VTSWSDHEAWNFSMTKQLDYDTRYERAHEFVEVITGLWDSWDADAFLLDKESGIIYDEKKMHVLDHVGKHFSVRGPLSGRRSPQGRPILVQAGASEPGQQIAAEYCDMVFMAKFRDEYEGRTLRENLGIPIPASRYDVLKAPSDERIAS
jgi:alkanesulfonate monooxygenase SsuD/methylene tetrahydromethanopterin reductase-like flavin-dependent oxidoreductase (luciferase family)